MGGPPEFGGFAEVDRTGAPEAYAGYLDGVRGLDAVAEWKARTLDLLEPRPGARLLDLGCGTGEDALALAARCRPGGRVVGIDASTAMIEEARRRASGREEEVELLVGDGVRLPLEDASVDGCRTERTLQHVPEPAAVIGEMRRVTRAGGRIVAAEPDWGTLVVDSDDPEVGRLVAGAAADRFRSGGVGRTLRRLMLEAGLEEVEVVARTLVVTDRRDAEMLFDLGGAAERASAAGLLRADRARAWTAGLEERGAGGGFLAALTSFMAWGRAPHV